MKSDEAFLFIKTAIERKPELHIVNSNRGTLKMQLVKLHNNGQIEAHFELSIVASGETCQLRFTVENPDDKQKLAKLAQGTIWAIGDYGYKIRVFRTNNWLDEPQIALPMINAVLAYLKEHPMSTIEQISDSVAMLQATVARILFEIHERGILRHTPPEVEPRKYSIQNQ